MPREPNRRERRALRRVRKTPEYLVALRAAYDQYLVETASYAAKVAAGGRDLPEPEFHEDSVGNAVILAQGRSVTFLLPKAERTDTAPAIAEAPPAEASDRMLSWRTRAGLASGPPPRKKRTGARVGANGAPKNRRRKLSVNTLTLANPNRVGKRPVWRCATGACVR